MPSFLNRKMNSCSRSRLTCADDWRIFEHFTDLSHEWLDEQKKNDVQKALSEVIENVLETSNSTSTAGSFC